jgi:hypothetical protein
VLAAVLLAFGLHGPGPLDLVEDLDAPEGPARVELSGPEIQVVSPDGNFLIHYTTQGSDRPEGLDDTDGNGRPQVIDRIIEGLSLGVASFRERGYRELLLDNGAGGSRAIDLYLTEINANGYAFARPTQPPGPAHSCSMRINPELGGSATGVLESVVVHELHHCVQYAYTTEPSPWIYEATATFEQYRTVNSDVLDAASSVLWYRRLSNPHRPIDDVGDQYEYAGMVFMKFWEEYQGGDPRRIPDLWEAMTIEPYWRFAIDYEARRLWDQGIDETFLDFVTWNLFACARDDGAHYGAEAVPCLAANLTVPITQLEEPRPRFDVEFEDATHTAAFFELQANGDERPLKVVCEGPGSDARARLRLVALDRNGAMTEEVAAFGRERAGYDLRLSGTIDPEGSVALVVASVGREPALLDCAARRAEPLEVQGRGCNHSGRAPSGPWPILLLALVSFALRGRLRTLPLVVRERRGPNRLWYVARPRIFFYRASTLEP